MNTLHCSRLLPLATIALLGACGPDSREVVSTTGAGMDAHAFFADRSPWSEPVHLGPPVNSPFRELNAELSPDELSLYFGSNRPGGLGEFDIWVSHRACLECPWEEPINLGANINSPGADGGPLISTNGHLLFFSSSRAGGEGGEDVWVSRRVDPKDDLGWGPAVNLGPDVNTAANEGSPAYVPALGGGDGNLYFERLGATLPGTDIYWVQMTPNGETLGPAALAAELNSSVFDGGPTIRADGREVFFWSLRTGGIGGSDIWVATRRSPHDPWSAPQSLGPPVNTEFGELVPDLSRDGRTLFFSGTATRGGSIGLQDIWMSTRTPSGQ